MRIRSGGIVFFVSMAIGTSGRAGEPSPAELIALAPNLQSVDPTVRSLELVGTMKLAEVGEVRVRALYRAPDRYSMLISDAMDGTPLVYAADHQLLFYDPIRSSLSYLKDCSERLTLDAEGKAPRFVFGFGRENKKIPEVDFLKLDVKSLCVAMKAGDQRVIDEGAGRYRLFLGGTRGMTLVCSFDTTRPVPFQGLKLFEKASNDPALTIDKVVVDGTIKDDEFRVPDRAKLAKKVKVHELAGGFLADGAAMVMISKAIRTRFEAKHPGLQATIKPPDYEHQSWKAIEKHDQKYSALLRELLPVDRYAVPSWKPKKGAALPASSVAGANSPTIR